MNLPPLDVLTHYAALSAPDTELAPDVYLLHDRWTLTIFDKFPKAKYHFLVLPRVPFPTADNQDDDDDDSNELDRGTAVSSRALTSLQSLLTTTTPAEALNVLRRLEQASLEAVEMVKDEMMKTEGFEWGVEVGFHAVPSMRHLHLHVISTDFVSPSLKTKKHYNSFHPTLGFFLPLSNVINSLLPSSPSTTSDPPSSASPFDLAQYCKHNGPVQQYEPLLKTGLTCCHCHEEFGNIPALKRHLEDEWGRMKIKGVGRYGKAGKTERR